MTTSRWKLFLLAGLLVFCNLLLFSESESMISLIRSLIILISIIFYVVCEYRHFRLEISEIQHPVSYLQKTFFMQMLLILILVILLFYYSCPLSPVKVFCRGIYATVQLLCFLRIYSDFKFENTSFLWSRRSCTAQENETQEEVCENSTLMDRINILFEQEKVYLKPDLQISDVAEQLFTNKAYISKTINGELKKSFRDFVNYHRVREAMRLYILDPSISMDEMLRKSGFKNYSSFYTAFKLHTGNTPGEWRKKNHPQNKYLENEKLERNI